MNNKLLVTLSDFMSRNSKTLSTLCEFWYMNSNTLVTLCNFLYMNSKTLVRPCNFLHMDSMTLVTLCKFLYMNSKTLVTLCYFLYMNSKTLLTLQCLHQKGFVAGRFIGDNIRLIYDILFETRQQEIPGLLLSIDIQQAFDSVSWKFIDKTLHYFNFGPLFKMD